MRRYIFAAAIGIFAAVPATAAVTFVDASAVSGAKAEFYGTTVDNPPEQQDFESISHFSLDGVTSMSSVMAAGDSGSASASQSMRDHFVSASTGTIDLSGAIQTAIVSPANAGAEAFFGVGLESGYRFFTDTPAYIDFSYLVSGTRDGAVAPNAALTIYLAFHNSKQIYEENFVGAGMAQVLVQPEDIDMFTAIANEPDNLPTLINAFGPGRTSASYNAHLSFNIVSTTPEPATW